MPGILPSAAFSSSVVGPAHLMLQRAERCFRRARHAVSHTLRVSSVGAWIDQVPAGKLTRFVPCAWGVRRDDYRWQACGGRRDCAALHSGATAIGWALVHTPLPAWVELMPGPMVEVMGKHSDLYLADYWLLTLHYLVWSRRLPYPIKARWVRGNSVHDECFDFVSELPIGVAEASLDALILFREACFASPHVHEATVEAPCRAESTCAIPAEPPVCRDGRWCMNECENVSPRSLASRPEMHLQPSLLAAADAPTEPASPTAATEPPAIVTESGVLELDDQSFTARCGASIYRFAPRNKQLFALLERINHRPGHRVSFEDLCSPGDVWDGLTVEDSTIRGAVARLRKLLKQHRMEALAARIATGSYRGSRYVVLRSAEDVEI